MVGANSEPRVAAPRRARKLRRCGGMPDPSHLVIARVHGVSARSAELRAAAEELADSSGAQEGCLGFDVLASPGRTPSWCSSVRGGASRTCARISRRPHTARYVSAVTELLTRPSDVTIYAIVGDGASDRPTCRRSPSARADASLLPVALDGRASRTEAASGSPPAPRSARRWRSRSQQRSSSTSTALSRSRSAASSVGVRCGRPARGCGARAPRPPAARSWRRCSRRS